MTAGAKVAGAAQSATAAVQTAPGYSAVGGAVAGVVVWALATYVFKGGVPGPVETLLYIVVPAGVAFVASHLTRKYAVPAPAAAPAPAPDPPAAGVTGHG